jgi:hypothetical protein
LAPRLNSGALGRPLAMAEDLNRYPEALRGDSPIDVLSRRHYDQDQRTMYRFRRIHLALLIVMLVAVIALVLIRGITWRGAGLAAVVVAIVVFRSVQLRKSRPAA